MSRRVSFWGGLSLSLLMLGGCLLADVGIDPKIDEDVDTAIANARGSAGVGGSSGPSAGGGSSGSASIPAAGSGGGGASAGSAGNAGSASMAPDAAGGAGGSSAGTAGTGNLPPPMGAAGTGPARTPLSVSTCPDGLDREQACAVYCGAYTDACAGRELQRLSTGTLETPYDYANSEDCARFCRDDSNWLIGNIGAFESIMCRCHHSTLAVEQGPNPHCFHAARVPSEGGCALPAVP